MIAKDIMTATVVTVAPDTTVPEIARLLIKKRISAVPVVGSDGALLGIVSEGDLVHRIRGDRDGARSWWLSLFGDPRDVPGEYVRSHGSKAEDVMTRDVVSIGPDTPVAEIAELLETRHVKRVPVLDDGRLAGIVSRANLMHALVAANDAVTDRADSGDSEIRAALTDGIARHPWVSSTAVNVVVRGGIVRLFGFVESDDARKALRLAAENIHGVAAVEDHLSVAITPSGFV